MAEEKFRKARKVDKKGFLLCNIKIVIGRYYLEVFTYKIVFFGSARKN